MRRRMPSRRSAQPEVRGGDAGGGGRERQRQADGRQPGPRRDRLPRHAARRRSPASRASSSSPAPSCSSRRGASRRSCSPPATASTRSTTRGGTAFRAPRRFSGATTSISRSGPRWGRQRCRRAPICWSIAGPKGSFVQPELDAFSAYLNSGGRMLVMLDPTLARPEGGWCRPISRGGSPATASRWSRTSWSIPRRSLPFFGPETIFLKSYGDHPVTKALAEANVPVLVSLARSARAGSAPGIKVTELMRTSAEGWGETDLAHLPKVVVRRPGRGRVRCRSGRWPRAIDRARARGDAAGRRRRLRLRHQSAPAGQRRPTPSCSPTRFNWLVEREALLGIPPKKTEQVKLTLTGGRVPQRLSAGGGPAACSAAMLGGFIFFRRRR